MEEEDRLLLKLGSQTMEQFKLTGSDYFATIRELKRLFKDRLYIQTVIIQDQDFFEELEFDELSNAEIFETIIKAMKYPNRYKFNDGVANYHFEYKYLPSYTPFEPIPNYESPPRPETSIRVGDLDENDPIRIYLSEAGVRNFRTGTVRRIRNSDYVDIIDFPTEEELNQIIRDIDYVINTELNLPPSYPE